MGQEFRPGTAGRFFRSTWHQLVVVGIELVVWRVHCAFAPIPGTWEGMAGRLGPAQPLSHSTYSLHLGVLQSYCQFSLPEPMFRKVAGGSCQLLGPGPRNGHRFAPLLLPVLSIKAEAAQNQREESKDVKGGLGVWTLLGASLSSSEDSHCTCLTVILVIKWVNA